MTLLACLGLVTAAAVSFPVAYACGLRPPLVYTSLARPPALPKDRRRRIAQGWAALCAEHKTRAVTWSADQGVIAATRAEITAAWAARLAAKRRPANLRRWARRYARAREVGVLRVDGQLAAWMLGRPGRHTYRVIALQMTPAGERYFAGFDLEAALVDRLRLERRRRVCWGRKVHVEAMLLRGRA